MAPTLRTALLVLLLLVSAACGGTAPPTPAPTAPGSSTVPQSPTLPPSENGAPTAVATAPSAREPGETATTSASARTGGATAAATVTDATGDATAAATERPSEEPTATPATVATGEPTAAPEATAAATAPAESTVDPTGAAANTPVQAGSQELRYKYRQSQRFRQTASISFRITGVREARQDPEAGIRTVSEATVRSVNNGQSSVRLQYTNVRLSGALAPASGGGLSNDQLALLTRTVVVDELGKVIRTRYDSPQAEAFQSSDTPGAASPFGPVLAENAVAPGDTWTATQESTGDARGTVTSRYTLQGYVERDGRRLARIRMEFEAPNATTAQGADVALTGTQDFLFDPEAGHLVSMTGRATADLRIGTGRNAQTAKANYRFSTTFRELS